MREIIINEYDNDLVGISEDSYRLDLSSNRVKNCIGCWSCWWKTPGRCIYNDLNEFYHNYITADKAIFICKTSKGFVTSNIKNLFDRMIPLYLPYVYYSTGESMHVTRYDKYPNIEFYYEKTSLPDKSQEILDNYINRTFYQFHSLKTDIKDLALHTTQGGSL